MGVEKLLISASLCHYVIPNIKIFQIWMVNFIKRFIITSSTRSHYLSCSIDCLKPRQRMICIFMSKDIQKAFHISLAFLFARQGILQDKAVDREHVTIVMFMLHSKPSVWGIGASLTTIPDQGSHLRVFDADADISSTSAAGLPNQDNLKSCPEAVSGIGVLRCLKTSEGNSLTKRVFVFGNAANRTNWI